MNEYLYEEIEVGQEEEFEVLITEKMMDAFCQISGDINPLHTDLTFAQESGYDSCVVYGMLTASEYFLVLLLKHLSKALYRAIAFLFVAIAFCFMTVFYFGTK